MAQQDFFDLARINIAATADDQIFGAVHQCDKAVGIEASHIPRIQPAVTQGGFRGLRLVPVAGHHHVAPHRDFPHFTRRQRYAITVDNTQLHVGPREPDRSQPILVTGMGAFGVVLLGQRGNRHRGFRPGHKSEPGEAR